MKTIIFAALILIACGPPIPDGVFRGEALMNDCQTVQPPTAQFAIELIGDTAYNASDICAPYRFTIEGKITSNACAAVTGKFITQGPNIIAVDIEHAANGCHILGTLYRRPQ